MPSRWAALPTLAVLAAAYVLSQFFRTALAVVAPEIAADLGLDPARLGVLSSAWFWAFAAAQIPIGVALDRWGPRRTVATLFCAAGLGCLVFALAGSLGAAVVGQILIGIGCAPVFMGVLVVLSRFYPPQLFAQISSILLAVGTVGTLAGTTPLAMVAGAIGWRGAFLGMAAAVALVALLVALVVRDRPPDAPAPVTTESLAAALRGVRQVLTNRRILAIVPMCFAGYAVLITVRGLWAGPYLAEIFGFSAVARGNALLAMSVAMILGNLTYGMLERRLDRRRPLVVTGAAGVIAALVVLAALPTASAVLSTAALVVIGAMGMTYALLMAQGRRFLAEQEIGRGLTLLNAACFAGAATVQAASGLVVELGQAGGGTAASWRALFLFLAAVLTLAVGTYVRSADPRRTVADRG
jgi:predicted MFS family arabinose efflux permease